MHPREIVNPDFLVEDMMVIVW